MIPYVRNLNIEKFDIQDTADGSFSYIVRCKNASKVEFNIYYKLCYCLKSIKGKF